MNRLEREGTARSDGRSFKRYRRPNYSIAAARRVRRFTAYGAWHVTMLMKNDKLSRPRSSFAVVPEKNPQGSAKRGGRKGAGERNATGGHFRRRRQIAAQRAYEIIGTIVLAYVRALRGPSSTTILGRGDRRGVREDRSTVTTPSRARARAHVNCHVQKSRACVG